jgi:hypothetical protein
MSIEYIILFCLVWLTFISLIGVILIYGLLTPWYKSRTGIGFMSTKVAFAVTIGFTIAGGYGFKIPIWLAYICWGSIIVAVNWGITWNILYKQFFEHRADAMADKNPTTGQVGVIKGTGVPRLPEERKDHGNR